MTIPPLDAQKTAVVTIDMHRGHLDPAVATMPAARAGRRPCHRGQQETASTAPAPGGFR